MLSTPMTVLTAETEFKGTLGFSGDLQLHGRLEGAVEADQGVFTIGESAIVKAEIQAHDIVIYGKVQGNITATGRLELRGRAQVYGDIRAATFLIEEGALFVGRSEQINGPATEKPDFTHIFTKLGDHPARKEKKGSSASTGSMSVSSSSASTPTLASLSNEQL